jgi:nitroreductase
MISRGGESMDAREVLYTTRCMRRMRTDSIPEDVQLRILDAAIRAPSPNNSQAWRFLAVDDRETMKQLAALYREIMLPMFETRYGPAARAAVQQSAEQRAAGDKIMSSARYLTDHFDDVPLVIFAFDAKNAVAPAAWTALWNAQLAARIEGVGSAIVSALLANWQKVSELLGIPAESEFQPVGVAAFGYPLGRWDVAPRRPVQEVAYRNRWAAPLGAEVAKPLWPA